jgi:3-hydroxyisobutyrate dehydrogenase
MTKIAFIGLGNMGLPMALNLLKAEFNLKVFDLNGEAVKKAVDAGAVGVTSIVDVVSGVDVVITMLPHDAAVKGVYAEIFNSEDGGALLIDCSTISADAAVDVANKAENKGFTMIDAPVSGGTAGAAAGTLTFIVGGATGDLEKARPMLEAMGKNIFHAGDHGAGQMAKICNNMLLAIQMIGTAEALNMGMEYGLDPKVMSEIMKQSSGNNWCLQVYNPVPGVMDNVPASRDYEGGFGNALMAKDLGLAQVAAKGCGVKTPMGKKALELYEDHSENYGQMKDFSSIFDYINNG